MMTMSERLAELKRIYKKRHNTGSDAGGEGGTSGNWGGGATVGTEKQGKQASAGMVDPRDLRNKKRL